ncbi:asparaginase [Terrabacter sp. MAHUQ-38]|uniref:asparaginase n=1 Tax=unclassified Terrabacter TaxID=2630222 RepID=UPI00165E62C7|nr:asparaginase [Terrabacter sp. MAHUQ-38]MBC9822616.1 asparaginase [Terrabacter sp. MAHUQ-38]
MANLSYSLTAKQQEWHDPTASLPAHVPVAVLSRGPLVESVHHGSVAVTDADGRAVLVAGDGSSPVYPRSALKPLQAVAALRLGVEIDEQLLAVAAASHSGGPEHVDAARRILGAHGLDERDLRNTADLPYGAPEREALLAAGGGRGRLVQNCSGNHALVLAACVVAGWPTATYLHADHPVQTVIRDTLAELAAEPVGPVAIDGCGMPVLGVRLPALARAYGRLAVADPTTAEGRVASAMRAHPHLVGGAGRDVTESMAAVPGLVAKDGAEGVQLLGLPDGTGVAVKIADGADRARMPVAVAALAAAGGHDAVVSALASLSVGPASLGTDVAARLTAVPF